MDSISTSCKRRRTGPGISHQVPLHHLLTADRRAFGFVGKGGGRERVRESEGERQTRGYEPLREAETVVAVEGGTCSLPEVGGGVRHYA